MWPHCPPHYGNNINSHEGAVSIFNVQSQPHIDISLQGPNANNPQEEAVSTHPSQNVDQPVDTPRGAQEILRESTPSQPQDDQIQEITQSKFDSTASPQKMEPTMKPSANMFLRRVQDSGSLDGNFHSI